MIAPEALMGLLHEIQTMVPTVLVNPADEQELRSALGNLTIKVTVDVTELAPAGELTVFSGARRPIVHLGGV